MIWSGVIFKTHKCILVILLHFKKKSEYIIRSALDVLALFNTLKKRQTLSLSMLKSLRKQLPPAAPPAEHLLTLHSDGLSSCVNVIIHSHYTNFLCDSTSQNIHSLCAVSRLPFHRWSLRHSDYLLRLPALLLPPTSSQSF